MIIPLISVWISPSLSVAICAIFVSCVAIAARRFHRELAVQQEELARLRSTGFPDLPADSSSPWIHWIYEHNRNPRIAPPSRIEAINEFDNRLFHRGDYAFLVRSREYAPFIGLLLTALSAFLFYHFELDSMGEAPPGQLIGRVLPLLSGVAFGAVLNLGCSFLLQWTHGKANAVRSAALEWFDQASAQAKKWIAETEQIEIAKLIAATNASLTDRITLFLRHVLAKTEEAHKQAQEACREARNDADRLHESAMNATNAAEIAATTAAQATVSLNDEINKLRESLSSSVSKLVNTLTTETIDLRDASAKYRRHLAELTESTLKVSRMWTAMQPDIQRMAEGSGQLNEAVRGFRDALAPAAKSIEATAKNYKKIADDLEQSATDIHKSTDLWHTSLQTHSKSMTNIAGGLSDTVLPVFQTLATTLSKLDLKSAELEIRAGQIAGNLDKTNTSLKRFDEVSLSFGQVVEQQFVPSAKSLDGLPAIIQKLNDATDAIGNSLKKSTEVLAQAVAGGSNTLASTKNAVDSFGGLVDRANLAAQNLDTAAASFATTTQGLATTSENLRTVTAELAPAAGQIRDLRASINSLGTLAESFESLAQRVQKLDELVATATRHGRTTSGDANGGDSNPPPPPPPGPTQTQTVIRVPKPPKTFWQKFVDMLPMKRRR